jgi:hypothetical protein
VNPAGTRPSLGFAWLHLLTIWTLAVAQPLFAVLGQSAHFFVAHQAPPGAIVLFAIVMTAIAPAPLLFLVALARAFGAARFVQAVLMSLLVTAFLVPVVVRMGTDGTIAVILALAAGSAAAWAYDRLAAARLFLTCLSPAVVIVPAFFILATDVRSLVGPGFSHHVSTAADARAVPVVLVVVDELPLVSLLDDARAIDRTLFPSLAAFSAHATWFRNCTTVAEGTVHAVPAIVTGRYPQRGTLPVASSHPRTLFTWLASSHRVHAAEAGTQLCPEAICGESRGRLGSTRILAALMADSGAVLLHVLLPPAAREGLPPLDSSWAHFWAATREPDAADHGAAFFRFVAAAGADRGAEFQRFVQDLRHQAVTTRPAFHYVHTMLAHIPWLLLPSGALYDARYKLEGWLPTEGWVNDADLVAQAQYRHLLAASNADRLIGRLFEALKDTGEYDGALIIVTADHGASFGPGDQRRTLTPTNLGEVVAVPLLVKFPGQHEGRVVDDPVQTIDIVPTIAEVLETSVPWPVDGQSLLGPGVERRRTAYRDTFERFDVPDSLDELIGAALRRRAVLPRSAHGEVLWPGPAPDLVGRAVTEWPKVAHGRAHVRIEDEHLFAKVDTGSRFVPAYVRGSVLGLPDDAARPHLAIAINGVVGATTWGRPHGTGHSFSAMLPPRLLRPGVNALDVFVLPADGRSAPQHLAQDMAIRYRMVSTSAGERLVDENDRAFELRPDAVSGWVDQWMPTDAGWRASGWAVDRARWVGAHALVAFVNGEMAGASWTYLERPDVAQHLGRDEAALSGFAIDVERRGRGSVRQVRIFALTADGFASELVNPVEGVVLGGAR